MTSRKPEQTQSGISAKSFLTALLIIFILMCATYLLTFFIPGGAYDRALSDDGTTAILPDSFHAVEGGLPFWKWLLSPFLVLTAEGSGTVIAVIAFLLVIGGVFNALSESGLMNYMLQKIVSRFGGARYKLLAVVSLFFMAMGSFIGSFEECVPLVPIVVSLAVALGFDELTGLGMSLLSIGCGFAAGVCNPFTVGVAQKLAGLPMFSGAWLRLLSFVLIYAVLLFFLTRHAKRIEIPITERAAADFKPDRRMDNALVLFAGILLVGIAAVFASAFLPFLQDYTMIIVAVVFLLSGIVSALTTGMTLKTLGKYFVSGVVSIFPAVLMILMASSIKYTLTEAHILDAILHGAVGVAKTLPSALVILFIYLIVVVMNFFISSGSAKAFLLIPLITPLAQIFGISSQLTVLAFAFGDGFSNVLYPTNAVLLISLGLVGVNYVKWFKWVWKFQAAVFVLTSLILLLGLAVGY